MPNQLTSIAERRGWEILPDTDTNINRLRVRSETGSSLYLVSQTRKNRIWQCDCFGARGGRKCKHIAAVASVFEALANPTPASALARPAAPASPASKPSRPAPARLVPPPQPEVIIIRVTANIDGRLNGMVPTYCRKLIEDALRKMPGVHNLAVEVV